MTDTEFKFSPLQEEWLQALESGEWKQNSDCSLRSANGHCCLGVGAEVLGLIWNEKYQAFVFNNKKLCAYLSEGAHVLLGLRDDSGSFAVSTPATPSSTYTSFSSLVDMNDGGVPFADIATYIRANPRNVFNEVTKQ